MTRLVLLLSLLLAAQGSSGQIVPALNEGIAHRSRSWTWQDYQANNQNWGVAQDDRGVVFVANSDGLLEYGGEVWRLHSLPLKEETVIRSVAVGPRGRIFVGGFGDVGFFSPDARGFLQYESLRPHIPEDQRGFSDVWTTHLTDDGVVFQSAERLFRWDGRRMRSWSTDTRFRTAFLVEGVVYVWEEGVGLKALRSDQLRLISGGRAFADRKVDAVLPHERGLLLIVRDEGLVLLDDGEARLLDGTGSEYLRTFRPYTAVPVPNRYAGRGRLYAVATFFGGVAIVTSDGRLVRVYREDVGLTETDQLVGLRLDDQGGLWVAHINGIVRIDLFARSTWFDQSEGLVGSVYVVEEHRGGIYAGTTNGLFRMAEGNLGRPGDGPAHSEFQPVEELKQEQTWSLLSTPRGLLVGAASGVYAVEGERVYPVSEALALSLLPSPSGGGRVLVGRGDGVGLLDYEDGRWRDRGRIEGVEGETRSLVEDGQGGVWASQTGGSMFYLSDLAAAVPTVQMFGRTDGLTVSAGPLLRVRDEVWVASREGVFAVSRTGRRLRLAPVPELRGVAGVYGLNEVGEEVWLTESDILRSLDRGRFRRTGAPFGLRNVKVIELSQTRDGVVWIGTSEGLLRYDRRIAEGERSYPVSVRLVTDRDREPLYGGAGALSTLRVPYDQSRQIRFEVAAPFFDAPGVIEYQFRLEGFEDDWSTWGPERVTSYTNLWEGSYTLHIRARDTHGRVSEEGTFALRLLPPWYRTWWAYGIWVSCVVGVVWQISAWRVREHRRRLAVQRARSARLQRLSARLERANVRLRQADRLKDDLLANTSHELRTPLTAVLGFSEMLLEDATGETRALAEGIHRGGQRLLGTVNGLLDMFKLQSGTMPIQVSEVDAAGVVRESVSLLQPLATSQGLDLHVVPETLAVPAALDPELLNRVLTNLVGNAIKFTPNGRVLVTVDGDEHVLRVSVRDTGIGIAQEDAARIFEPFEQASSGYGRTHEGTGLGLAIVKRVLDLVGGHVTVESDVGCGTTILVTVPRYWSATAEIASEPGEQHIATLEGAHVLGMGLDAATVKTLRGWIEPHGAVRCVDTIGRAVREAKKTAYDTVLISASDAGQELKWMRLLRSIPGYEHVAILRVGGELLDDRELAERGFLGQVAKPLDATAAIGMLEGLLARVEATVPA